MEKLTTYQTICWQFVQLFDPYSFYIALYFCFFLSVYLKFLLKCSLNLLSIFIQAVHSSSNFLHDFFHHHHLSAGSFDNCLKSLFSNYETTCNFSDFKFPHSNFLNIYMPRNIITNNNQYQFSNICL